MRHALRDWRLVIALSVIAAGTIGYNVIRPMFADRLPVDSALIEARVLAPEQPVLAVATTSSGDPVAMASRIRATAAEPLPRFTANSNHGRDPFAPAAAATSSQAPATTESSGVLLSAHAATATDLPAVTAIVVTDRWRAAVVDGQFVAPGARVGDRVVARIDLDAVQLRGAGQPPLSLAYAGATR